MRHALAFMACGLIMLAGSLVSAQGLFDSDECKSNCGFRYSVERDYAGTIQLPDDSIRREGYLNCVKKCDAEFWQDMNGPDDD